MGYFKGTSNVGKKVQKGNLGGAASDYATGKVWREDWKSNTDKLTHQSGGGQDAIDEKKLTPPTVERPTMAPGSVAPTFAGGQLSTSDVKLLGPTAATIDAIPQNQFRDQQYGLAQQLAARASGQGPMISELALKQAQDTNQAQAFAQLASARGGANPMLARNTMNTSSNLAAQTGRDAALAKLSEMQGAQSLLGQVAAAGRGQDIGLATNQAGLSQQATLAGYQGSLDQMKAQASMNQNANQGNAQLAQQFLDLQGKYAQLGLSADQSNQLAAMEAQKYYQPAGSVQRPVGPSVLSGAMTGVGAGVGAYFGGPAGAAAGAKIGSTAGGMADNQYGSKKGEAAAYNQQEGKVDNSNQELGAGLGAAAGSYGKAQADKAEAKRLEDEKNAADTPKAEDDFGDGATAPTPRKPDAYYNSQPGSGQGGRRGSN